MKGSKSSSGSANRGAKSGTTGENSVRLDQWLHAARFFKTRALSAQEIKNGRVLLEDKRCKPAQAIKVGDTLSIKRGPSRMHVVVQELSTRRASASVVANWYQETEESRAARQVLREQLRLNAASSASPDKRPDKKSRRKIIRFIRGD